MNTYKMGKKFGRDNMYYNHRGNRYIEFRLFKIYKNVPNESYYM